MHHTAYKVTVTRNAYGDYLPSGETAMACRFRAISEIVTGTNNETIQSDAMAWFEPDSGIVKKDIVKIEGEHYMVERTIGGADFKTTNIPFVKTWLTKYGVIS